MDVLTLYHKIVNSKPQLRPAFMMISTHQKQVRLCRGSLLSFGLVLSEGLLRLVRLRHAFSTSLLLTLSQAPVIIDSALPLLAWRRIDGKYAFTIIGCRNDADTRNPILRQSMLQGGMMYALSIESSKVSDAQNRRQCNECSVPISHRSYGGEGRIESVVKYHVSSSRKMRWPLLPHTPIFPVNPVTLSI